MTDYYHDPIPPGTTTILLSTFNDPMHQLDNGVHTDIQGLTSEINGIEFELFTARDGEATLHDQLLDIQASITAVSASLTALAGTVNGLTLLVNALLGGASISNARLIELVASEAYEMTSIVYSESYPLLIHTAVVKWPDGSDGWFEVTDASGYFSAIDAYTVTHALSGKTVTQPQITRDSTGNVLIKPALVVT